METVSIPALFLAIYWVIFWYKFLINPYLLCTSELASTYFPFWIWMGRKWKPKDEVYYKYPACIPFLSMWYPPNVLLSKLSKYLSLNSAFKLYAYFILGHYLLGSFLAYIMFRQWGSETQALFGALTLTYAGYCIKPQTPSFVYTICWIPLFFSDLPFKALFLGIVILGGYWPILVYLVPFCAIFDPINCLLGLFLAFPQILPFLWYWPRSVRATQKIDGTFGKLPWWKLKDLFLPSKSVGLTNGVHYPEVEMYMGIAPFFIFSWSWWLVPLIFSLLVAVGSLPPCQRIPGRSLYLLTLSLCMLASKYEASRLLVMVFFQSLCLLRNNQIYPSFPFSQWWDKPSKLYSKKPKANNWPFLTGYLKGEKISDYQGAFALAQH